MITVRIIEQAVNAVYLNNSKRYPDGGIRSPRPAYSAQQAEHSRFTGFFIILCWHYELSDYQVNRIAHYNNLQRVVNYTMQDLNQEEDTVQLFKQVLLQLQILK